MTKLAEYFKDSKNNVAREKLIKKLKKSTLQKATKGNKALANKIAILIFFI